MHKMAPPASYDRTASLYDVDMGLNNPGRDIAFYVDWSRAAKGPVLDLGCGTGRITIPILLAGCDVVGLDASEPMLAQLAAKAVSLPLPDRRRLRWVRADMRDFRLEEKFSLILCPFAAFTYMVTDDDQSACLERVREHLQRGGLFILDSFVPRAEFLELPDDYVFHDYRRELSPGVFLERTKRMVKNPATQVNRITRNYRLTVQGKVVREFSTEDTIRYFYADQLRSLLVRSGFDPVAVYGDYDYAPYSEAAHMMVFVMRA